LLVPTAEEDEVARQPPVERGVERRFVVADDPERDRLAPQHADGVGEHRRVGVVNGRGADRRAGGDDLVAGREDRDPRPADDLDRAPADRGEDAGLARGELGAPSQDQLAPRHVGPGEADPGPWRDGANHEQIPPVDRGVLDHHDRVGPARDHGPGREGCGRPRLDHPPGDDARRQLLGVEPEPTGPFLGGTEGLLGAHREAVHVRAVERGDVDLGDHVGGQNPPERLGQRDALGPQHPGPKPVPPAPLGGVAIHDVEKLLLLASHLLLAGKTRK
jgi:hypothetical protein